MVLYTRHRRFVRLSCERARIFWVQVRKHLPWKHDWIFFTPIFFNWNLMLVMTHQNTYNSQFMANKTIYFNSVELSRKIVCRLAFAAIFFWIHTRRCSFVNTICSWVWIEKSHPRFEFKELFEIFQKIIFMVFSPRSFDSFWCNGICMLHT